MKKDTLKIALPNDYAKTLAELVSLIQETYAKVFQAIHRHNMDLYWQMGKMIVEKQQKADWGDEVIEYLASDLQSRFQNLEGFSSRNLWRIRQFYIAYQQNDELASLAKRIGWTHNYVIMQATENNKLRFRYKKLKKNRNSNQGRENDDGEEKCRFSD
jgi:hypothetical protein